MCMCGCVGVWVCGCVCVSVCVYLSVCVSLCPMSVYVSVTVSVCWLYDSIIFLEKAFDPIANTTKLFEPPVLGGFLELVLIPSAYEYHTDSERVRGLVTDRYCHQ